MFHVEHTDYKFDGYRREIVRDNQYYLIAFLLICNLRSLPYYNYSSFNSQTTKIKLEKYTWKINIEINFNFSGNIKDWLFK